jgi:hypothetical protein
MTRLLAMLALLNAGQSMAGDYTATNHMPEMIHNLMAAEGDGIDQTHFSLRPQNPNSLRNLKPVKYPQFIPLKLPTKNAGWTLWNNSSIRHHKQIWPNVDFSIRIGHQLFIPLLVDLHRTP